MAASNALNAAPGVTEDLDAIDPVRTLCAPVRRLEASNGAAGGGSAPMNLRFVHGRAASIGFASLDQGALSVVLLQQCGRNARVVRSCSGRAVCSSVVLGSNTIAWTEPFGGFYDAVYVRKLRDGRPRGALRSLIRSSLRGIAIARDRLFVLANGRLLELST